MATTLMQMAAEQDSQARTDLQTARASMTAAETAARQAADAFAAARTAQAAAAGARDSVRAQLALAQTPAQVAALQLQLKAATVALRQADNALGVKQLQAAEAAVALEAARAALDQAQAAATAAAAQRAAATTREQRWQALRTRDMVQPPVSTVAAQATAALSGADFTTAKARIDAALPQVLRDRARERAQQAAVLAALLAVRERAGQAAVDHEAESTGLAGDRAPRLARALDAADAALSIYAGGVFGRLDSARATLRRLASLTEPLLTPAQKASLDDPQGTARADAAQAQHERDAAAVALAQAAATLAAERIKALATSPDTPLATLEADAVNHAALKQAKDDLAAAQLAYDGKAAAYTGAMATTMAEWQAEVPEALWSEATTFFAAADELTRLAAGPGTLLADLAGAETALVGALEAAAARARRQAHGARALERGRALAEQLAPAAAASRGAQLRGELDLGPLLQA